MHDNPYAPPSAALCDIELSNRDRDEALRRAHLRHEVQLKAVGTLYLLFGSLMLLSAMVTVGLQVSQPPPGNEAIALWLTLGGLAAGLIALGVGFRGLRSWVRIPGGVLAGIGLLGVPVGTLINGWILYLMFCTKGRTILSPDYRQVIAATPHVRYRRTAGDWIALGIVLLLLLGIVVLVVVGMR